MPNIKGFALEKLEALRERLLDLTARNRMINSKFSAYGKKHFRIIDEIPQQVYEKLSSSSMTLSTRRSSPSESLLESSARVVPGTGRQLMEVLVISTALRVTSFSLLHSKLSKAMAMAFAFLG